MSSLTFDIDMMNEAAAGEEEMGGGCFIADLSYQQDDGLHLSTEGRPELEKVSFVTDISYQKEGQRLNTNQSRAVLQAPDLVADERSAHTLENEGSGDVKSGHETFESESESQAESSSNVFKLIGIKSDRQDASFVEKIIPLQGQVLSFCNALVPKSARVVDSQQIVLDFKLLDGRSLPVLGFYGDKEAMVEVFSRKSIVDDATLLEMNGGRFEPGFYASLHSNEVVYLFYWHEGEQFEEATRKSLSCNFVRYVTDLCDTVYVCLKDRDFKECLSSYSSRLSGKTRRTTRHQVSRVKASEDDFLVFPGFTVKVQDKVLQPSRLSPATRGFLQDKYFLSDGLFRIALLAATDHERKPRLHSQEKDIKSNELSKVLDDWSSSYDLDVTSLSDGDLLLLSQFVLPNAYEEHSRLKSSIDTRSKEHQSKLHEIPSRLEKTQKIILQEFERALDEYINQCYFGCPLSAVPSSIDKSITQPAEQLCDSPFPGQSRDSAMVSQEVSSDDNADRVSKSCTSDSLSRLEEVLWKTWLGDAVGKKRLIFEGSEIELVDYGTGQSIQFGMKTSTFVVESATRRCDSKGPLRLGGKVSLIPKHGLHAMPKSISLCISAPQGACNGGLLLAGEKVKAEVVGDARPWKVCDVEIKMHEGEIGQGMRAWMESLARRVHPYLWKNACYLSLLIRESVSLENCLEQQATYKLLAADSFEKFKNSLPSSLRNLARENDYKSLEQTSPPQAVPLHPVLAQSVSQLCGKNEEKMRLIVQSMVKKEIMPLLKLNWEYDHRKIAEILSISFAAELQDFFSSQRLKLMSNNKGSRPLLYIRKVMQKEQGWSLMQYFPKSSGPKDTYNIAVAFETQEVVRDYIARQAVELLPMKKDLDNLSFNSKVLVVPIAREAEAVMEQEVEAEQLLKLVLLKSGKTLLFIRSIEDSSVSVYLYSRHTGSLNSGLVRIHNFKRGCSLLAFDELSRFLAIYDQVTMVIKIYRFDEPFTHCDWTGMELSLSEYSGSNNIIWMDLVPGRNEVLLADDTQRVRVVELTQPTLMKPKYIRLIGPLQKACLSPDGSCLITLRARSANLASPRGGSFSVDSSLCTGGRESVPDHSTSALSLEVYRLGDSLSLLKTIDLDFLFEELADIQAKAVVFGTQMHLVFLSTKRPQLVFSKVLEITYESEVCRLLEVGKVGADTNRTSSNEQKEACPPLSYIFHIFDKYAVSPPLGSHKRLLNLNILLNVLRGKARRTSSEAICRELIKCSVQKLKEEKGKDFSDLELVASASFLDDWQKSGAIPDAKSLMGNWIRQLVCLVPIQIARAESNGLRPLSDGLEIPPHFDCRDSVSLSSAIRFGFYSAVFDSWNGCIKVISSMGKQSSGKSYLLNHLTGSLLDVAGGRCTDGVWMTVRASKDCLYVLLDFEGLGSFERSNQEDVLLSVLNAAVSNITLFNKKDFHLDKETEAVFERFQNGVNLVKEDEKLFKGLFYIAIKDVDTSDVEDLKNEFSKKIDQICRKSQENFLTKMYGGEVEIAAMPPFHRPEFHESVVDIALTVEELETCYNNGRNFSNDLKLVIAQISARDWSPLDSKRVALKLHLMRKHLDSAIKIGCLNSDTNKTLATFDSQEEIPDDPIQIGEFLFNIRDQGLELAMNEEKQALGSVLGPLRREYGEIVHRTGQKDEVWHSTFEKFLNALAERRTKRVLEWVSSNTSEFSNNGDVQKLNLEVIAALAELKQGLSLCGSMCIKCFLRCTLEKGHPHDHSCMGDHFCMEACSYCTEKEEDGLPVETCSDRAGHDGPHDCKQRSHTCGKPCHLASVSSQCSLYCSLIVGHSGFHKCNSPQHMCTQKCSAPYCKDSCTISIETGPQHDRHSCHQMFCTLKCCMNGCARTCATKDHFHALDTEAKHFCEYEHPCYYSCEGQGICEVLTQMVRQTRSFHGSRGSFEYEYVSEQNGLRKGCCLVIPPSKDRHEGPHSHTTNPDAVHYCETKCKACGYFCHLHMGHPGLHDTAHGNMRLTHFVADDQEIDIMDRKYTWGESGIAEMCMMHCKSQGRGHIHLMICPEIENGVCTSKVSDGARHEARKYGPDEDTPKDEMTHEAYWKYMRFADPCTQEEQEQFALCNHYCRHEEHQSLTNSLSGKDEKSYCTEKLWHSPISRIGHLSQLPSGYISDDGHHFACNHSKNVPHHIVFVIDKSGSMGTRDIRPTLAKLQANHENRLGCVYESILRFVKTRLQTVQDDTMSVILFDWYASVVIDQQDMNETVLEQLCEGQNWANGGTTYSAGLELAESLIDRSLNLPAGQKSPLIIFLSDGGNNGGIDPVYCVKRMKQKVPNLVLHTIMFGNDPDYEILKQMANAGSGTFQLSLDEVQLARSFEGLALSLKPKTVALMH